MGILSGMCRSYMKWGLIIENTKSTSDCEIDETEIGITNLQEIKINSTDVDIDNKVDDDNNQVDDTEKTSSLNKTEITTSFDNTEITSNYDNTEITSSFDNTPQINNASNRQNINNQKCKESHAFSESNIQNQVNGTKENPASTSSYGVTVNKLTIVTSYSTVETCSIPNTEKTQHTAQQILVIDRDIDNTENLFEYTLQPSTQQLFDTLNHLNIEFTTEIYKPKELRLNVDPNIFYCKNLFIKDRKGKLFLVICHEELNIDLKKLRQQLGAYRNFNFGTAKDMGDILGVEPGGVTPLALMLPTASPVNMVIHNSLIQDNAVLMFHPMDSNLAVKISLTDLLRFLKHFQHPVKIIK